MTVETATDSTRSRIIDQAMLLFATRGYANTSIGDVAEAAGLLKGNLSYYFRTKQDLLQAVTQLRREQLRAHLSHGLAGTEAPAEVIGRLLDYVEAQAEALAHSGCPLGSLATELGKHGDAAAHACAASLLVDLLKGLELQFARCLPAKQAAEQAEALLASLQGAAVLAQALRDPAVVHRRVQAARQLLASLGA